MDSGPHGRPQAASQNRKRIAALGEELFDRHDGCRFVFVIERPDYTKDSGRFSRLRISAYMGGKPSEVVSRLGRL